MTSAPTVKFSLEAVRDRDDRTRVERRRRQLMAQYAAALTGVDLGQHRRVNIARAAELVSLLELAWVKSGDDEAASQDASDFLRLGELASEAVTKFGLPPTAAPALSFGAAVGGLMSKSGANP